MANFDELMSRSSLNALDITDNLKDGSITPDEAGRIIKAKIKWIPRQNPTDYETVVPTIHQWERVEMELAHPDHWSIFDALLEHVEA